MADDNDLQQNGGNKKSSGANLSLTAFLLVMASLVQLLFINANSFNETVQNEVKESYKALGKDKWVTLTSATLEQYNMLLVDSGFKPHYLDKVTRQTNDTFPLAKTLKKLTPIVNRFVNNLQTLTYQLLHRINLIAAWAYVLVPFIVAQLAAGVYNWRIRAYTFGNKTKARILILRKVLRMVLIALTVYFFLPCFTPAFSAYIPVLVLVVTSLVIKRYIETVQKFW